MPKDKKLFKEAEVVDSGTGVSVGIARLLNVDSVVELVASLQTQKGKASIHSVYDGFNDGLRASGYSPIESSQAAETAGKLYGRPARGGRILSTKPLAATASTRGRNVAATLDEIIRRGDNGHGEVVVVHPPGRGGR